MVLAEVKVDNIYIVCGYTDMRKSIAGLSAIIVQQFEMRPDEHSMFLFCGKRADRMKALIWEETVSLCYTRCLLASVTNGHAMQVRFWL